jgi:hypothetical protein
MERKTIAAAVAANLAVTLCVSMLAAAPTHAQQVTGVLGSRSSTTTIDDKQLPPPSLPFGGVIKPSALDSTPGRGIKHMVDLNSAFSRLLTPWPSTTAGRTEFTYAGEVSGIPPGNAPSILDRDYTVTADLTIPKEGAEGMILTMGGRFGGYGLYLCKSFNWWHRELSIKAGGVALFVVGFLLIWRGRTKKWSSTAMRVGRPIMTLGALLFIAVSATAALSMGKGRPVFVYNLVDLKRYLWQGSAISAGKHTLAFDFKYDGPGPGKGGTGVLSVDGKELSRKTIPHTMPLVTLFETFDVGINTRTLVDESYDLPFRFTGKIDKLSIKVGPSQLLEAEQVTAAETIQTNSD